MEISEMLWKPLLGRTSQWKREGFKHHAELRVEGLGNPTKRIGQPERGALCLEREVKEHN